MRKTIHRDDAKFRNWEKEFNKAGYIYGLQRNVKFRKFGADYVSKWYSRVILFKNFTKAIEWYLVGSGARQLGDEYDKRVFEECYNGRIQK